MKEVKHHIFNSITALHNTLGLPKPKHPLVSVVNLDEINPNAAASMTSIAYNFYAIFLKNDFSGKVKYGQQYYDFDEGTMTFYAPKQLITIEDYQPSPITGWMLVIHPDFIYNYPLAQKIREYGFFSYATNEALHLSDDEDTIVAGLMENLKREILNQIDNYSQDVIISHVDLLLNYCNRFYNRQFITRKKVSNDMLVKFETLLKAYTTQNLAINNGLPTVHYFSDQLALSPNYLNDLLKNLTGLTTQQHIHNHLIEVGKELLISSNKSVSEIAYTLGFGFPQSFNKFFKSKTNQSPLQYRNGNN